MKILKILIRATFVFIAFLAVSNECIAQKGYPFVSPFTFDGVIENENFDLIQDDNFNILIANRKGILSFDSRKWDLLPLPYYPVVLAKSSEDGTIYAGCRNGFGILEQDETGKYVYSLLSDTMFTGEISNIEIVSGNEYFISRNRIYFFTRENQLKFWEFSYDHFITGSFTLNNEFYFMIKGQGLYKSDADTFKLLSDDDFSVRSELVFALETSSKEIVAGTGQNEIYKFNGYSFSKVNIRDSEYLNAGIINGGAYLGGNEVAIGTLMGGVIILDYKTGTTTTILNSNTGLPDDEIFCLGTDSNSGLWLCHSFGISRIDKQLNVSNLTWYPGLSGNLTNVAFYKNRLYIGTSDGLYTLKEKLEYREKLVYEKPSPVAVAPAKPVETIAPAKEPVAIPAQEQNLSKREIRRNLRKQKTQETDELKAETAQEPGILERIFSTSDNSPRATQRKKVNEDLSLVKKKVYALQSISHAFEKNPLIKGKCTEILAVKDHLLVSTYNGLYDIYYDQVRTVIPDAFISFINPGPDDNFVFAGNEKSLYIIRMVNGHLEVQRELDALDYPVYSACMTSPSELWIGSDNAVHKLTVDAGFYIDKDENIPVPTKFSDKVIVKIIGEKTYLFLSAGIFTLESDKLLPVTTFEKLSSLPGYYFATGEGVWYRSGGAWNFIGAESSASQLSEKYLSLFLSVQDIYPGNDGDLYIVANNKEIYHLSKDDEKVKSDVFSLFFSGIKGTDDQLFPLVKPKISYKKSSLRIEFSAPYYLAPGKTEFSFKIEGLNDEWSNWSNASAIEYPLLPPGAYSIQAKARNIFGKESEISHLDIVIRPPFWRTMVFYILVIILVFVSFGFFVRFRERALQHAKQILEQKVKERTAEIERQKNEISEQKKEITDSIFYARRIQTAILPSPSMLSSVLSEHFVLFLPKDIVSGDFYWSTVKENKIVLLAADCTGHGVPGAFMSMLGVSFLNEIVNSKKPDDAATILNELREHVKSTLANSGGVEQARDGMDIALCIIDQKKMVLQYAGAYNPLYMIRAGQLTEYKANKMPIGLFDRNISFTNNIVNLKKGDCYYIFSDGFADQFGGPMEKKFLSHNFKNLLLEIHAQPMNKQKDLLVSAFNSWKGKLQQVDDVLVIGFRI